MIGLREFRAHVPDGLVPAEAWFPEGSTKVSAGAPRSAVLLLTLLAMAVSSIPFWTGPWLGMVDYPNHLSRYFILAHRDSLPDLQRFYAIVWRPLPNVGLDVAVLALHAALGLPVERCSQILVAASGVALIPATVWLHRALFGRWSYWPLASAILVFNSVLLFGFVNYLAGVAAALGCGAAWLMLRRKPLALRLAIFTPAATLLFFMHLVALGTYGLIWLTSEIWFLRRDGVRTAWSRAADAGQFLPSAVILLLLSPTAGNTARLEPSSLFRKSTGLLGVVHIGPLWVTIITPLVLASVLGVAAWRRWLRLSPLGVVLVAAMTLTFLLMPFTVLGSSFADFRLPIVAVALAIAATDWRGVPRRAGIVAAGVLAALALTRVAAMTGEWMHANRRYADIMRLTEGMEPGRLVLPMIAAEDQWPKFLRRPPLEHAASLAVITRQALIPTTFADPSKQPVTFTPPFAYLLDPIMTSAVTPLYDQAHDPLAWRKVAGWDYVLLFAHTPLHRPVPGWLHRIDDGSVADVMLFRVGKPSG